jgi:hypothetical protein
METTMVARRTMCMGVLSLVVLLFFLAPVSGQETVVKKIIDAWKKREDLVESVKVEWEQTTTYRKGSLPTKPGQKSLAPPEDRTVDYKLELTLGKNNLMRFRREGLFWDMNEMKFLPNIYMSTFDGSTNKDLFDDPEDTSHIHRVGFIIRQKYDQNITNYEIWPLWFFYRPHELMGRSGWTVLNHKVQINGRSCTIMKRESKGIRETCWIDEERRWALVRYSEKTPGLFFQMDISYEPDNYLGWVPMHWTWQSLYGNLTPRISTSAQVMNYKINLPLSSDSFTLNFPPGTLVSDSTDFEKKGWPKEYLVKEDGGKRYVTYQDRMKASSPAELRRVLRSNENWWGFWVLLILGGALLVAIFIFFIWRKRFLGIKLSLKDR